MKRAFVLALLALATLLLGSPDLIRIPLQIGPLAAQTKNPGPVFNPTQGDVIAALSDRFESVAQKVLPSVVSIEAIKPAKADGKKPVEESGSGVLFKSDARPGFYVITNNHVIALAPANQITVQLADGRVFKPTQVWSDPETDIAVLGIEGTDNLPVATLGNSDKARVGRWVLAMGSPFGLSQTVTHGIISARDRGQVSLGSTIRIKEFLQTDAAINPGSSGGPLVDLNGEVIGINTAIASHNGSNSGVAFSIPINLVKRVANQMLANGAVTRGYLGMQLAQVFEANEAVKLGLDRVRGALVEKIFPDTPATTAGLQVNDVILQVENIAIRNENHLINLISGLNAGQRVRMQVWRDRSVVALDATVGDWAKAQGRFRTDK